jgi:hypothetical protein
MRTFLQFIFTYILPHRPREVKPFFEKSSRKFQKKRTTAKKYTSLQYAQNLTVYAEKNLTKQKNFGKMRKDGGKR